jgi:regulator of protease activity HflC (stomatin/prohibitin superfamily)
MKKTLMIMSSVAALSIMLSSCAERVDPGYVGIKVNYYGSDRGVEDLPLLTGMVWYNPFTQTVYEFPTFVQTTKWTEEKKEEVTYTSKEGMVFSADVSLSYQIKGNMVPAFYVKFRTDDITTFTHGYLRNVTKDAFNEIAAQYATDELYSSKKDELLIKVRERVNKEVSGIGVELVQLGYVSAPRPPETVTAKINAKIIANQEAEAAQNKVAQIEAEARQRVAAAEGEANANRALAQSISPTLLEWRRLEILDRAVNKWDGTRPQVEGMNSGGLLMNINPKQ